jgi:putative glycosyltransferase (TIGR04348 family)
MKIHIVCPAPPGSRKGNRVTAERWRRLLANEGHDVTIAADWRGEACDVLLAMHARRSFRAAAAYRRMHPHGPLTVALTGTDIYRDLPLSKHAQQAVRWADRLIGLHHEVARDLPQAARGKLRVVLQSIEPTSPRRKPSKETFDICVLGHLRQEKDPTRAALALRALPRLRNVRLFHAGEALTARYARWAKAAMRLDHRYHWLGEISRTDALKLLASSRLMVISSRMEGGANVVSEAIVNGVPILASRISGNVGLLGRDYRGYFPVADTAALAKLIDRACTDERFYDSLRAAVTRLAPCFQPRFEQAALARLMAEVGAL